MTHTASMLVADHVGLSYRSSGKHLDVLDDIELYAAAGEFISIVGPSGCGKTSLLSVIAGLDRPDSGSVSVEGCDVTGRIGSCAYLLQHDLLMPWRRVVDNAMLGLEVQGVPRSEARRRVKELMSTFGLSDFEQDYPFQLSGGMRQRVAVLRTVLQDRPILLLDEPFGALDSLTRGDMQQWLQEVWTRDGRTVVLVTHDVREAIMLSDRVYVLSPRPGRVVAEITIALPRPRTAEITAAPEFIAREAEIRAALVDPRRATQEG